MMADDQLYPETGLNCLFEADNFEYLDSAFFGSLRQSGKIYADPSGWIDTVSEAARLLVPYLDVPVYSRYYLDVGNTLGQHKDLLCALLSAWEAAAWTNSEVTICPSVSAATFTVLAALKRLGVCRILSETPCYFATLEQAKILGMEVHLFPSYRKDNFKCNDLLRAVSKHNHALVWLAQPKVALGMNQQLNDVTEILDSLQENAFLVVDEATDQSFPSLLGSLKNHRNSHKLIKLKNFTKPMGLNGIRLAAILHNERWRSIISASLENFGGSVDINSLELVISFSRDIKHFHQMLKVSNLQVTSLCRAVQKASWGTDIEVLSLVNGYIGSLVIPVAFSPETFPQGRRRFLEYCRDNSMPIIIGPSMYFACDRPAEFVRLNYLNHEQHLLRAVEVISNFLRLTKRN